MNKSLKAALAFALALVIIPTSISAPAQAAVTTVECSGGGTFTVDGTTVTGSSSTCAGEVVIPANVTRIDFFAFRNRSLVTSARFETGSQLESISNWAFQNSGLTSIDLPDGMWELGYQAFIDAKLTSISIPGTVTSIGDETLSMSTLESVVFETRIASGLGINSNTFKNSLNLQSVTWTGGKSNTWGRGTITKPGFIWFGWSTKVGGAIVADSYPMPSAGVTLYTNFKPDSIIQIPCSLGGTFRTFNEKLDQSSADCAGEVVVPAYVELIGGYVFQNRSKITNVRFEEGSLLKVIDRNAFENSGLMSIDLPDGLERLEGSALKNTKLTSLSLPGSVDTLWWDAIMDNLLLETVVFERRPAGARDMNIAANAFHNNRKLESLTFTGPYQFQIANNPTVQKPANDWLGWSTQLNGPIVAWRRSVGPDGITYFVNHSPKTYNLTFNSMLGSSIAPSTIVGGAFEFPAPPTRDGYTFDGWSRNANDSGSPVFDIAEWYNDSNLELQARWISLEHELTFDSKGGTTVASRTFLTGSRIESAPEAPTRRGYTFAGWSEAVNGNVIGFPYSPSATDALTLYAVWTINTYVVNFDSKSGSSVPSTTYVTDGQLSSAPEEPILLGYTFEGWSATDGGTTVSFPYAPGVIGNITLYAVWSRQFVINFDSNGGSAVVDGYFKEFGSLSAAPTAPTRRGYTFAGWSATDGGTAVAFPYAPGLSEDINLYALWTVNNYAVTYNANGGVAVPNGSFTVERDLLLVTPIRVGYTFNGWSATNGGSFISFPYAPGVVENITLYANWTRNPYKPELLANATVSGTGFQSTNMKAEFGSWSAFPDAVLSVQWYRCDKAVSAGLSSLAASAKCVKISGATETTYKVVVADELKYLTVLVQAKNSVGTTFSTAKSFRAPELKAPSKVELPDVSGEGVAKQTLTVDIGTWKSNPIAKTSIQWFRCEGGTKVSSSTVPERSECVAIKGAASTRYRLVKADEGKYVTAQIEAENSEGTAFTTATSVRVALTPSVASNPGISGSSEIGKVLSASSGRWLAFPAADTSVQWFRCNKETLAGAKKFGSSTGCVAIKGATKTRYTLTAADRGKHISALVTAENIAGDETVTTASQQVSYEPTNTTDPRISGTATVGRTLEATSGGWTGFPEETISFAWYRCSSPAVAGSEKFAGASGCVPISGANQSSYTVIEADQGKYIAVLVKARNSAGSSSATSKSTAKVG